MSQPSKEKLYDAMGELIYAVALADGMVSEQESQTLHELLQQHDWAASVEWSFKYEKMKANSLEDAYQRALDTCKSYGPCEDYVLLLDVLRRVSEASDGMVVAEADLINRFTHELTDYFKETL